MIKGRYIKLIRRIRDEFPEYNVVLQRPKCFKHYSIEDSEHTYGIVTPEVIRFVNDYVNIQDELTDEEIICRMKDMVDYQLNKLRKEEISK